MSSLICAEEIAYNEIRQRILDGRLAPGTRLVHRILSKEFGFSSGPVVLALRTLERDGLVTNTPGLGAHVTVWKREEIIDLYHIRAANEGLAARFCAERASKNDIDAIVEAHDSVKRSVDAKDSEANIKAEIQFHAAVVAGAHSSRLEKMIESLSIMQYSMRAFAVNMNIPRLLSDELKNVHQPIIDAILNRAPESAELAAREHVESSLNRNLEWIDQLSSAFADDRNVQAAWWAKKTQ